MSAERAPTRFTRGILSSLGNERRYRGRDDTGTPRALFLQLNAEFGFTLDAAASAHNTLCARFFSIDDDALARRWAPDVVWCNPPYSSKSIGAFVAKAFEESRQGATCVLLVPVRADLGWWHDYALHGEIRFVRGRIRFNGMPTTAPFASCVVIFRPPVGL